MSAKSKQKRPEYTLEFKQDAARLVNMPAMITVSACPS